MAEGSVTACESASSSGLDNVDVAVFLHETRSTILGEIKQILQIHNISSCTSVPAGRPKTENAYSAAHHSRLRVFVMTGKFIRQDLPFFENVLLDPKVSRKENTLFITTGKKQERSIPKSMKHFQTVHTEFSAQHICDAAIEFLHNIKATAAVTPCSAPRNIATESDPGNLNTKFRRFQRMFGRVDSKRGYVLIASPIENLTPTIANIALIPWLRVFDFDPKSRISGLLSVAEPVLKSQRHHTKSDRLDDVETPDENVTNWVFIKGYTDNQDGIQPNSRISAKAIRDHADSLVEHCVAQKSLTVLTMWYPPPNYGSEDLDDFLQGMDFIFRGSGATCNWIICLNKMPETESDFYRLLKKSRLLDSTLVLPINLLCDWLPSNPAILDLERTRTKNFLPRYSDESNELVEIEIDEEQIQWINVHFHTVTTRRIGPESDLKKLDVKFGKEFLKGNEITWDVIEDGNYDARRILSGDLKKFILERHIEQGKSGVIKIFHSPGGGGSTFAKRMLWELRNVVPCLELTSDHAYLGDDLREKLLMIRDLTNLAIILLVDGKSDSDTMKILDSSRNILVVVLQVQRYYSYIHESREHDKIFWLSDVVSPREDVQFCSIYSKVADARRLKPGSSKTRRVFEYGLSSFSSGYKGLRRYVHGYLQLTEEKDLENWHHVLAHLSMAHYYGHRGLPSELFRKILNVDEEDVVELKCMPESAQQFITENQGNWKITHYNVSNEILEQIFMKRDTIDFQSEENGLTTSAKKKLAEWSIRFIKNVKDNVKRPTVPKKILDILFSIFIKRYYNDPGEREIENKSHFSRLIDDAKSETDQCNILQELVNSFPKNAELHAHLGRFYHKRSRFDEAIESLKTAVKRRETQLSSKETGDDVLERIYNMFGYCYNSRVRHAIGAPLGKISKNSLKGKLIPSLIKTCIENAEAAVEKFRNARIYPRGANPTFSLLGEIKVRLHLSELAHAISNGNLSSLEFSHIPEEQDLWNFVRNSASECDQVLAKCIHHASESDNLEEEINLCINYFQYYFKSAREALERWIGEDNSVQSKKCHVSILKMQMKKKKNQRFRIYDISNSSQLFQLVSLYEGILEGIFTRKNLQENVSVYMIEWLQAIRHKNIRRVYTQTEVLAKIKKWNEAKEIGSLATFYEYVVTTLLALSSPKGEVANTFAEKANKLKDQIQKNKIPLHMFDKSLEWLSSCGNAQEFKRLINRSAMGERNGRFWTDKDILSKLEVCTGTIHSCRKHNGIIVVDGDYTPSIQVFFVPQRYDISASHSKQLTRVQFYLGFNPRHNAEAFEVTRLQKFTCEKCKSATEIPTLGKSLENCSAQCFKCEAIVYAKTF